MVSELQQWIAETNKLLNVPGPEPEPVRKLSPDQEQVIEEAPYRALWVKCLRESLVDYILDNCRIVKESRKRGRTKTHWERRDAYWKNFLVSKDFQMLCDLAGVDKEPVLATFERSATAPRETLSLLGFNAKDPV